MQCNLETGEQRFLFKGEPLRFAASVAVAADGTVAVLDRALNAVVVRVEGKPTRRAYVGSPVIIRADDLGHDASGRALHLRCL